VKGDLYGTTDDGGNSGSYCGTFGCGTVFKITTSGEERVLHSFAGPPDGAFPKGTLIVVKGSLYGTTYDGGAGNGTVFKMDTSGKELVLHTFRGGPCGGGANPEGSLVFAVGMLYGTTSCGGAGHDDGTVFLMSTSGSDFRVLHSFGATKADGQVPVSGLALVGGALYGTTIYGGPSSDGIVFEMSTAGVEKPLYAFTGLPDGSEPRASAIGVRGALFGTTASGGAGSCTQRKIVVGCGTVFKVSTSGAEHVIYAFKGYPDGQIPAANLTYTKGAFYGTTSYGGTGACKTARGVVVGCGTVFKVTASGSEQILYSFEGGADGANPTAGLTLVNGMLYGTTFHGGGSSACTAGCGTVFQLQP
jgi:uncharacterized repeat protein (TIGR03803 family)